MNRFHETKSVGRIGIFVDVQHLFYTARNFFHKKVNYKKLMEFLGCDRDIVIAEAFLMFKENEDVRSFTSALKFCGFDIKRKNIFLRVRNGKEYNISSWDIGITVEMIKWAPKVDTIVLVSGGGIFVDAIQYLQSTGCRVEVAAFEKCVSKDLKETCTDFVDLTPKSNRPTILMGEEELNENESKEEEINEVEDVIK